ncbi:ribosome maturation factor RimP [Thiomicrospira cyclica]|uniref:Ribosome maturation factor RimP n=1 Tax=Thiomicrospira cyclica (strain DSM 14477 / JCM 11371 / ALM1) TaxID=717773 RepID=F6DCQ3_THICA|nr:ribosome maturation factor RimP [Thiomicrospira cyclica]AEG31639.1 Ribosome maturation factor rimP [Thiomicrospira cyclica ALM1]
MTLEQKIADLVTPAIEALGMTLWGCEYIAAGKDSTLRIYIDRPDVGVNVDDCALASRQISAIMDVEDPISSAYYLEVSSPGLDRPFFKPEQYLAYVNKTVNVRTRAPEMGRRKFKGTLVEVQAEQILVEVDREVYEIPFSNIDKANLVVEL